MSKGATSGRDAGALPLVSRQYCEAARRFGVQSVEWSAGRVVLVARTAPPGADALAVVSEIAMAAAFASALSEPRSRRSANLRIGLVVVHEHWTGLLEATALASSLSGRGWLLDCQLKSDDGALLSIAFAYTE